MKGLRTRLAQGLADLASNRMQHRHPDWSAAMRAEQGCVAGKADELWWALGSLRATVRLDDLVYPLALLLSVAAMTLYQWSADENVMTLAVLGALTLGMGFFRPRWFLLSGVAVGTVVAGVNGFETASGIRPAYEIYVHTITQDLRWLALVIPAVASSTTGRHIHLKLAGKPK